MTCRIHFFLLNDHFSQEYADEHNNGESSELNRRYLWEDEFAIKTEVTAIDVRENDVYPLQGENENGTYAHDIQEMRLFYPGPIIFRDPYTWNRAIWNRPWITWSGQVRHPRLCL